MKELLKFFCGRLPRWAMHPEAVSGVENNQARVHAHSRFHARPQRHDPIMPTGDHRYLALWRAPEQAQAFPVEPPVAE